MATLKDIAAKAGVSIRTASRVMRGESHVSSEKVERVREVMRKLNYAPNLIARGLRTNRTNLLGIITDELDNQVTKKKLLNLNREADTLGYQTLLGITGKDKSKEMEIIGIFQKICDGFLFLHKPQMKNLQDLQNLEKPFLLVDFRSSRFPSVSLDRKSGIIEALSLVSDIYENHIFLTACPDEDEERREAFEKGIEGVKRQVNKKIIYTSPEDFVGGYKSGDSLQYLCPALVVCYNDKMAMGLLKRMHELGIKVPEDTGIIGFDNDDYTEYAFKALSTVQQPVKELAEKSLSIINSLISGNNKKRFDEVSTYFIPRQSTLLK